MSVNIYNKDDGSLTSLASGQRTWVGTQAAYKAAKQAGTLPNNAIIAITDDEIDHNHYSTEETETGMYWIDGKPIYRKVFQTTGGNQEIKNVAAISNVSSIVSMRGIENNSPGNWGPIPYLHDTSKASDVGIDYYNGYVRLLSREVNTTAWTIYIIVEYTKTTEA